MRSVLIDQERIKDPDSEPHCRSGHMSSPEKKSPFDLRICWNGRNDIHWIAGENSFKISEEECLVLLDWSADGGSELILRVTRLRAAIEIVAGIKDGVLVELIRAAMQFVCTGLHDLIDHSTAIVAVLRGEAVIFNFHLLESFDSGLIVDIRCAAFALFRRCRQCAIKANLRRRIALPIGNKIGTCRIGIIDTGACGLRDTCCNEYQAEGIAIFERNLRQILCSDIRSQNSVIRVQKHGDRLNGDRRTRSGRGQSNVEGRLLIDGKTY